METIINEAPQGVVNKAPSVDCENCCVTFPILLDAIMKGYRINLSVIQLEADSRLKSLRFRIVSSKRSIPHKQSDYHDWK